MNFLEYLTSNSLLRYPFTDGATLTNGVYTIREDFLIDAVVFTAEGEKKCFIKEIAQDGFGFVITVYAEPDLELLTFSVLRAESSIRQVVQVGALVNGEPVVGRFLMGEGVAGMPLPTSAQQFTVEQTEFLASVIFPKPPTVYTIGILEEVNNLVLLDEITLRAGCNVALEYNRITNSIELSAGSAEGEECDCEEDLPRERAIETIVGTRPDEDGYNFKIEGSDCINIYSEAASNMVVITDECRPCCEDCATRLTESENDFIDKSNDLDAIETRIAALEP